jgi:aconitate hydratase
MAFAGTLTLTLTDTLTNGKGEKVKLDEPRGDELPKNGFTKGESGYVPPAEESSKVQVYIDPESKRLQKLFPFVHPDFERDFKDMYVLLKAKGKCTTDHISMAGPWLKYRGHLDNISNNMFIAQ